MKYLRICLELKNRMTIIVNLSRNFKSRIKNHINWSLAIIAAQYKHVAKSYPRSTLVLSGSLQKCADNASLYHLLKCNISNTLIDLFNIFTTTFARTLWWLCLYQKQKVYFLISRVKRHIRVDLYIHLVVSLRLIYYNYKIWKFR